jgi:hypothetical protein
MEYDIEIKLSSDVGQALTSRMPNWRQMKVKLAKSSKFSEDRHLDIAHITTKHRLEVARVCLSILKAGYKVQPIESVEFLIRTMADSIFLGLAGSLDSLSLEINQVYGLTVKEKRIQIDHHSEKTNEGNCIRCELDNINDDLSKYLNNELPRMPIPQNHWYSSFTKYKNQVKHRLLYTINERRGGRFIPPDPSLIRHMTVPYYDSTQRKIITPNYKELKLRGYCELCLDNVLYTVEKTCVYLNSKV